MLHELSQCPAAFPSPDGQLRATGFALLSQLKALFGWGGLPVRLGRTPCLIRFYGELLQRCEELF